MKELKSCPPPEIGWIQQWSWNSEDFVDYIKTKQRHYLYYDRKRFGADCDTATTEELLAVLRDNFSVGYCMCCGCYLVWGSCKPRNPQQLSFDRINESESHHADNLWVICDGCNSNRWQDPDQAKLKEMILTFIEQPEPEFSAALMVKQEFLRDDPETAAEGGVIQMFGIDNYRKYYVLRNLVRRDTVGTMELAFALRTKTMKRLIASRYNASLWSMNDGIPCYLTVNWDGGSDVTVIHCFGCGKECKSQLQCAKCKFAQYCNKSCQEIGWSHYRHRGTCKFHKGCIICGYDVALFPTVLSEIEYKQISHVCPVCWHYTATSDEFVMKATVINRELMMFGLYANCINEHIKLFCCQCHQGVGLHWNRHVCTAFDIEIDAQEFLNSL
ncbi:MAG: zinc finger MYND domain-containing protein [Patescibacteria group bacterium]|nr:zinc finger MYND domain-containing protein [Patescibacteria group bacterium]